MGCSQSSPTNVIETPHAASKTTVVGVEKAATTTHHQQQQQQQNGDATTVASTVVPLVDHPPPPPSQQKPQEHHKAERFKKKLGYSSGGSSSISDETGYDGVVEGGEKTASASAAAAAANKQSDSDDDAGTADVDVVDDEGRVGRGEHYRRQTSTRHDALVHIKNDLGADGDIACGVVRIETDFGKAIEEVYEGVHDGNILGTGIAGVVRKVKHRETGVVFAVKCLNLGLIESPQVLDALREEIFIMSQLDHPNILRLEEVYESESQIFLIQELCKGGDLFDRLENQPDYHYTEVGCAKLVKQMLSAVRYLHSKGIIHRDIKLENFLFTSDDMEDNSLKMIDFGLSKHFTTVGQVHHEAVGTPYAAAPEIIRGSYDEKVDIWSLGVITYLLLSGESPFGGIDNEPLLAVRDNILACNIKFEPEYIWHDISKPAKKFVKRLLTESPCDRPTARQAQLDVWLQVYANKDAKESAPLDTKLVSNLCQFKEYSALHKVLLEVLSFTLLPEQIIDLKREFLRFDPEGVGEITLDELKQVLLNSAEAGSLGSLTETEVEDIFNALRVRKTDTTIRWHEFIAAGVSQSDFDDRNLKLAFDRLDYNRKGFITLEDLHGMLSTSDGRMDKAILNMWQDGLHEVHCQGKGRLDFDDFRRFLKGQAPKEAMLALHTKSAGSIEGSSRSSMSSSRILNSSFVMQPVPEGSVSPISPRRTSGALNFVGVDENLSMPSLPGAPPPTARRPSSHKKKVLADANIALPDDLSPRSPSVRSHSMRLKASESWLDDDFDVAAMQSGRAYMRNAVDKFQELSDQRDIGNVDASAANEELFKTYRDFRQSVLEASKLFEQKRFERKNSGSTPTATMTMKGGQRNDLPQLSSGKKKRVADATRRSGRPRPKNRTKTLSDLSEFMR